MELDEWAADYLDAEIIGRFAADSQRFVDA
jgi:hypothetical protein